MKSLFPFATILSLAAQLHAFAARAQDKATAYPGWPHSGEMTILTTPEGANLPAPTVMEDFPLLVRLDKDWFDFRQARSGGEDLRISGGNGEPLAYEIEEWDPANGKASVWVRIPHIQGNARQTIWVHWGKTDAASESNARAVFNESNGYLSVWHLGDEVRDSVGTLESKDVGTTGAAGMIGKARHFAGKQGIFCGDKIAGYPSADAPHSTEAWFRAEQPNTTIIGWGNEAGGRGSKIRMQFRSPPHLHIDSNFSDVNGDRPLDIDQWIHVVHTYDGGEGRIYINGQLDAASKPRLDIKSPARLWIGGWYHNYDFVGDIDEVRVSRVTRSADWVRLEYENQKPMQTLVGPIVQPGSTFTISPAQLTVPEGKSATFTAQAGGAQKVIWSLIRGVQETVVAVDRFAYTFDAGRVTGDATMTLRCKAIYPGGVKTKEIPITIKEDIADPVFTLKFPPAWDGRTPIEIVPQVTNMEALRAKGAADLKIDWVVLPMAVTKEIVPGKLILHRAQNSGTMTVQAYLSNGGERVMKMATIGVIEPKHDAWMARTPAKDEKPEEGEFYPRNDRNEGTLIYSGALAEPAEEVFLKVYADDLPYRTEMAKPGADKSYGFAVPLKPGLVRYRVEFGTRAGGVETVRHSVGNLVCGDAYLIDGQSNAEATAFGKEDYLFTSDWIRTFGSMESGAQGARSRVWGNAQARGRGGVLQVGYWGLELARRLVESQKMPICIINGAVGGTRIDQHQCNPADRDDVSTIYGRLLWRVREARLTHGIRGVLWHQGENDQGADGPTGGFGWENYRQLFLEMAAAWKQDYPNIQHYYLFQIWPKSCAMGINGSDNRLREVQRTLPNAFSNMSIMSTLGIDPPGGCHYPPAGYAEIARLICPLVERDIYGKEFPASITPPNLRSVHYPKGSQDTIVLEFDQPVQWDDALAGQLYLDGEKGKITSGSVAGNIVTLKLTAPLTAKTITYLDSKEWSQKTLLRGANGIAALTFCEVPIVTQRVER